MARLYAPSRTARKGKAPQSTRLARRLGESDSRHTGHHFSSGVSPLLPYNQIDSDLTSALGPAAGFGQARRRGPFRIRVRIQRPFFETSREPDDHSMGTMIFQLPAAPPGITTQDLEWACISGGPDNMPWPTEALL